MDGGGARPTFRPARWAGGLARLAEAYARRGGCVRGGGRRTAFDPHGVAWAAWTHCAWILPRLRHRLPDPPSPFGRG